MSQKETYIYQWGELISSYNRKIVSLKEEFSSLSDKEQNSQSLICGSYDQGSVSDLCSPDYKYARALVRLNDNFFDKSRPAAEWQSLAIIRRGKFWGIN